MEKFNATCEVINYNGVNVLLLHGYPPDDTGPVIVDPGAIYRVTLEKIATPIRVEKEGE